MISLRFCRLILSLIGLSLAFISGMMVLRGKFGDDVRLLAYSRIASEYHSNLFVRPIARQGERFGWQITGNDMSTESFLGWYGDKILWNTPFETYFSNWDGSNQQPIHDGDVMVGASPDKRWFSFAHWLDTEERYIYRFVRIVDHTMVDLDFPGQIQLLWLNDGNSFIYYTKHDVLLIDLDRPTSVIKLFRSPQAVQWVQLAPDGQSVYFVVSDENLASSFQRINLVTLKRTLLLEFDGHAGIYDFSPDSQWLVLRKNIESNRSRFYRISVKGDRSPFLLWEGRNPRNLSITNEWIIWRTWQTPLLESQLFSISMEDDSLRFVAQGVGSYELIGDDLLFSIHSSTSSYLVRSTADGSHRQVIARNIYNFLFDENSDWIVVTDPNFDYYRIHSDSLARHFLTNLYGYGTCFTCRFSSDGRYFGHLAGDFHVDSRLIKIDLETGQRIIVQLPLIPENEDLDSNTTMSLFSWTSHQGFDQIKLVLAGHYLDHIYRIDVESGIIYTAPEDNKFGVTGFRDEFTTLPITTLNIADKPHLAPFFGGILLASSVLAWSIGTRLRQVGEKV